jgi:hypothetical protein
MLSAEHQRLHVRGGRISLCALCDSRGTIKRATLRQRLRTPARRFGLTMPYEPPSTSIRSSKRPQPPEAHQFCVGSGFYLAIRRRRSIVGSPLRSLHRNVLLKCLWNRCFADPSTKVGTGPAWTNKLRGLPRRSVPVCEWPAFVSRRLTGDQALANIDFRVVEASSTAHWSARALLYV